MVKKILEWRSTPSAGPIWLWQGRRNARVANILSKLYELSQKNTVGYNIAKNLIAESGCGSVCSISIDTVNTMTSLSGGVYANADEEDKAVDDLVIDPQISHSIHDIINKNKTATTDNNITINSDELETVTAIALECATLFRKLAVSFSFVREGLKVIGNLAHVPVEPDTQSALLNGTALVNGVLCAGVPGAGGYDAVVAVVADDGSGKSVERVKAFWKQWKGTENVPSGSINTTTNNTKKDTEGINTLPVDIDNEGGVRVKNKKKVINESRIPKPPHAPPMP